jgi:hypothetical protein
LQSLRIFLLVCLTVMPFVAIPPTQLPHSHVLTLATAPKDPRAGSLASQPHLTLLAGASVSSQPRSSLPAANYDEQIGTTFTQNFNSLSYNVTAVAQSDSDGYGPAYLLNGLTPSGYWYQVGVAYNWPLMGGGYNPGFFMLYEVFNSLQQVVLPAGGGGGLAPFSGAVNSGDVVQLTLNFTSGGVDMTALDVSTRASASISYTALGASSFIGLQSKFDNANGFFTGLMTEWYHVLPYFADEGPVTYSSPQTPLSSVWMWIDEFNVATKTLVFNGTTTNPVSYTTHPTQFQTFASNGASESGDATTLITGQMGCGATVALSPGTLLCNSIAPTSIGLIWGVTDYPANCFTDYTLQESTTGPNGSWVNIQSQGPATNTTYFVQNQIPGQTRWWRLVDQANALCFNVSITSNIIQTTQPSTATLTYRALSDTGYTFAWNNLANYNGSISFLSYRLEESLNHGGYSIVYTTSSMSTTSYDQTLTPNTVYSLYLITTDECAACLIPLMVSTNSSLVTFQTPPLLTVSAVALPASVDIGQRVSLACSAAGGVPSYNYTWTFGDGSTAMGQYVSHTYDVLPTGRVITCLVADTLNTRAVGFVSVTIFRDPTVSTPTVSPSVIDEGQSFTLTALASGGSGGYTYIWTLPPGCAPSNSNLVSCATSVSGNYSAIVSVTDSNGFFILSDPQTILVHLLPTIESFTTSTSSLDLGQTMNFTVTASGGAGLLSYEYTSLPPGCTTANKPILYCTPKSPGTYVVEVTITDQAGETDSTFADLDVNPTNQILGVPTLEFSAIVGAVVAAVAFAIAMLLRSRRREVQPAPQGPPPLAPA